MAQLEITILTYDNKERNVCARIDLPKDIALPAKPMKSWLDFIKWILANPELLAAFIKAIIEAISSLTREQKTT